MPTGISTFDLVLLIPVFPLVAFILVALLTHRDRALSQQVVNFLSIGFPIGFASSIVCFSALVVPDEITPGFERPPFPWFALGGEPLPLSIYVDPASVAMLFVLASACLIAFVYASEAIRDDPGYTRFLAIFSLFVAGALGLLVFNNLLLFFILWEVLDVCTYLLVGFWHERRSAFEAGLKAFLATKVGDLFLLLGLALLYAQVGSLTYGDVFSAETLDRLVNTGFAGTPFPVAAVIALLFFAGAMGKSALFPLHTWLPEANEAPGPVAALIHTTTTSAGVFLLIRAYPLFERAARSLLIPGVDVTVVTLVGVVSAVFGALVSVTQRDVRRALSFTTVSQLGYTVAALGMGAYAAGVLHLVTSVFFVLVLFLSAWVVVRGMQRGQQDGAGGEALNPGDMFHMGGLYRRQPRMFWAFLVSGAALSGLVIPSKAAVLAQVQKDNLAVFWMLNGVAFLTAFGAVRQVCLMFVGTHRSQAAARVPWSLPTTTVPLVMLALLAVGLGWIGSPMRIPVVGGGWLATFLGESAVEEFVWDFLAVVFVFPASGLVLAFLIYAWSLVQAGEMDRLEKVAGKVWLGWLYKWMRDGFYVDELYSLVLARVSTGVANACDSVDREVLDEFPADGAVALGKWLATAGDWVDARLDACVEAIGRGVEFLFPFWEKVDAFADALVNWIGRTARPVARASGAIDLWLDRAVDLARPVTLFLARWSDVTDRGWDIITSGVAGVVRAGSLAFNRRFYPKSGKVQDHLWLASMAVLVLIVVFLLFLLLET